MRTFCCFFCHFLQGSKMKWCEWIQERAQVLDTRAQASTGKQASKHAQATSCDASQAITRTRHASSCEVQSLTADSGREPERTCQARQQIVGCRQV